MARQPLESADALRKSVPAPVWSSALLNARRSLHAGLDGRFGGLGIAFVEGEGRVELGLAGEQFLQMRLCSNGRLAWAW